MPKYIAKKRDVIEAWQFVPTAPIPVWVARYCHLHPDGRFQAKSLVGIVEITPGAFVIKIKDDTNPKIYGVLINTAEEFLQNYELHEPD